MDSIRAFQQQMDKTGGVPGLSGLQGVARAGDTRQTADLQLEQFHKGDDILFTRQKKHICPVCHGKVGCQVMRFPSLT